MAEKKGLKAFSGNSSSLSRAAKSAFKKETKKKIIAPK